MQIPSKTAWLAVITALCPALAFAADESAPTPPPDQTIPAAEAPAQATAPTEADRPATEPYRQTIPVKEDPELAQPALPNAAPADDSAQLDEVVVTARRTAENAQKVPVAVSAMSGDDLRREQINSPNDLNGRVPSLIVASNSQMRNTETPSIRGQGATFGSSPGVIMYIGEVALPSDPVANYQGGAGKFFDLGSIQILKGSQGTLFGRNTTGGAVLLEPEKPQDQVSASLRAGGLDVASEDALSGQSYEGMYNTPISDWPLLVRVGGQFYDRNGFTHDVVSGKDYDSKHYWIGRVGLTWTPTDDIDNYLLTYYSDSHDNGTAAVIEQINRDGLNKAIPGAIGVPPGVPVGTSGSGCAVLDFYGPSTNCGQDILDEQAARGVRHVQLSGDPNDILKTGAMVNKTSYSIDDALTLINIASYSTLTHSYRWDLDGSRAAFNEFINPPNLNEADIRTISEEAQLQGTTLSEALKYVAGVYFDRTSAEGHIVAKSLLFVDVTQDYVQRKQSFAPFAQATYDLGTLLTSLSGLRVTLGARQTTDHTSGHASILQIASGQAPLTDKSFDARVDNSELTYTAGLDYSLGTHLVYGKISRGYKTGGIAPIAVNPDHYTYKPEYVTNYEVGQKSDFKIGPIPLRLNSAIYYTDYTGLQKASIDAYVDPNNPSPVAELGQAVFNVGRASVAGLELDLTARPLAGVTLLGSYGYTQAKYKEFSFVYYGATAQRDCTGQDISQGGTVDMACIPFQDVPKQQASLSGRYVLPFDYSLGDVETALTYSWTARRYSSGSTPPEAEPGAWLPAVGLLNASLSWKRVLGSALNMQLFGTNLTNNLYRISNSNQWNLTYFQSSIYSEPRVIGLNAGYQW